MSRHVIVAENSLGGLRLPNNSEGAFDKQKGFWKVTWRWKASEPPTATIGSGIAEYSQQKPSSDWEDKFQK